MTTKSKHLLSAFVLFTISYAFAYTSPEGDTLMGIWHFFGSLMTFFAGTVMMFAWIFSSDY